MRKKGKSYQKYLRTKDTELQTLKMSICRRRRKDLVFMILFGIFLALCLFLIYIKLDTIISITITKSGLISSVSSKTKVPKKPEMQISFQYDSIWASLLLFKNRFKITDG